MIRISLVCSSYGNVINYRGNQLCEDAAADCECKLNKCAWVDVNEDQ